MTYSHNLIFKLSIFNESTIKNLNYRYKRVNAAGLAAQWTGEMDSAGARPTKHISIEFEIRWKFKTL